MHVGVYTVMSYVAFMQGQRDHKVVVNTLVLIPKNAIKFMRSGILLATYLLCVKGLL